MILPTKEMCHSDMSHCIRLLFKSYIKLYLSLLIYIINKTKKVLYLVLQNKIFDVQRWVVIVGT